MKKRVIKLIKTALPIVLLLGVYTAVYLATGLSLPCVFRLVTGLKCPGCGSHGAFRAAVRFDAAGVVRYNLMFPLELLYILYVVGYICVTFLKTGEADRNIRPGWLNIAAAVLFIGWWILRNILDM